MKKKVNKKPELKINEYAAKTAELEALRAAKKEEIRQINAQYEAALSQLAKEQETLFDEIQRWAEAHAEDFAKTRSQELPLGTLGFRKGKPKLETTKELGWDDIQKELEKFEQSQFLRVKTSLNKHALLDAIQKEESKQMLEEIGLKVVQDESFYINLK